jgi:hypothetical protein
MICLLISAYYRPPSHKGTSLQQLELSLSRINHASNTNIIIGGKEVDASILCGMFLSIDSVRLFLNKFHISFTMLFVSLFITYIEKIILDLPTNDPDQSFNNQSKPKKLFSFEK